MYTTFYEFLEYLSLVWTLWESTGYDPDYLTPSAEVTYNLLKDFEIGLAAWEVR